MSEVNLLLRAAAVQSAAERQLENSSRVNISGIAAITGISRGEVSRILSSSENAVFAGIHARQNITSRILRAWHCDPAYFTARRRPRDLKLFGAGPTFESLVRTYGQGIPIRAILDELKRINAIQLCTSSQKILPSVPLAINPRITNKRIRDFDAITGLFHCLLRTTDGALVEKVSGTRLRVGPVPPVRRKLGPNAAALLRKLQATLGVNRAKHRTVRKAVHAKATTVHREVTAQLNKHSLKSRRNFHRNP